MLAVGVGPFAVYAADGASDDTLTALEQERTEKVLSVALFALRSGRVEKARALVRTVLPISTTNPDLIETALKVWQADCDRAVFAQAEQGAAEITLPPIADYVTNPAETAIKVLKASETLRIDSSAFEVLAIMADKSAAPLLAEWLKSDDFTTAHSAAHLLTKFDNRAAIEGLLRFVGTGEEYEELEILSLIRYRAEREVLLDLLKHENAKVRDFAVEGLGLRRDRDLVETIRPFLQDADPTVCLEAALALIRMGNTEGIEAGIERYLTLEQKPNQEFLFIVYTELGDVERARQTYEKRERDFSSWYVAPYVALLQSRGLAQEAEAAMQPVLKQIENYLSREPAEYYARYGPVNFYDRVGDRPKEVMELIKAITETDCPLFSRAYLYQKLGHCYALQGKHTAAVALHKLSLRLFPYQYNEIVGKARLVEEAAAKAGEGR